MESNFWIWYMMLAIGLFVLVVCIAIGISLWNMESKRRKKQSVCKHDWIRLKNPYDSGGMQYRECVDCLKIEESIDGKNWTDL